VFQQRSYYVYMMMSSSRRALYTGITSRPRQRVWEHKTGALEGFSKQYHTTRLVYFEAHCYVATAIAREKQIKRWRREKKLALIESMNPQYRDLAAEWFEPQAPSAGEALGCQAQGPSTLAKALGRDDNG
jgi:putative endonuclease